jgi:WD40 repeat protein
VKSVEVVKYRDTNWLLSAGSDGLLTMSVIGNFSRLMQSPKFPNIFDNLVVSDDNSRFAVNNEQHSILIFKVGQLAAKPEIIPSIHAGSITSMFWVKNHLFTVGLDMKINEIDLATKKVVNTFLLPSRPLCADIDIRSRNMVVGCEDGGLYLVDLAINGIAKAVSRKVSGRVTSIRFLPKGDRIVYGTDKGSCNIIHLDGSTDEKYILLGHEALISQIKINEKYNLIVTSSYDGVVRLYDLNNVEDRAIVLTDHQSWVHDFVFTDDFNNVISGGKDNKIFLRPASTRVAYKALIPFVKNGLTTAEWDKWVGKDIPMQSNE